MKGILVRRFGGPEVLEYVDLPEPTPEADQVLISVEGASVNFADLKARSGSYHLGKKPPFIPGIDLAGRIIETGSAVKNFKPGDRVVAFSSSGAYAEKALADEQLTFSIPPELNSETAAAFPLAAGAALHMLIRAQLSKGERILIHAASGGVGSAAIQLARIFEASMIVVTTTSKWKEEFLKNSGADVVLDSSDENYLRCQQKITADGKYDIILNPIGGETLRQDLTYLNDFGRLVSFGKMSKSQADISPETLHTANNAIIGFSFGLYRKHKPEAIAPTIKKVSDLIASGQLELHIGASFSLKEASKAHDFLENKKTTGKVVLIPDQPCELC